MKPIFKKYAFTLMEVLVSCGIFTLIVAASYAVVFTSRLSSDIAENQLVSGESARIAMDRVIQELRFANPSKVWISNQLNAIAGQATSGSIINFQIPVGSYQEELNLSQGQLRWGSEDTEGEYIAYSVDNNNCLLRTVYTSSEGANPLSKIIARNISRTSFARNSSNSNLINIEIVSLAAAGQQASTQTLRSSVRLRNF